MADETEIKQQTEQALKKILTSLDDRQARNLPMSDALAKRLAELIKKQLKESLH